ncbi:low molecular weight protein arginine phosphatase [Bacillus sp. 1P06AnD]|uniref:low molecular weight protein arginine phosphatase n=1 Tax=Bacillus sp. 1P06AnD TaxID=3132208 RepID=UPI00399FEF3C
MTSVLFVCTGNTCRSPIAEALLKHMDNQQVEVRSAGVYAHSGDEASRYAQEVLNDHHIAHHHSARLLSREDMEWADYVLAMTQSHRNAIMHAFPQYTGKVFTLKEFVGGEYDSMDVMDPFGGTKQHYQGTFMELKELIGKLVEKLGGH